MLFLAENGLVWLIVVGIILFILIILIIANIRVVKQTEKYIIQRFGAYYKTWDVGVKLLIPFIDRVEKVVNLKEKVGDYDPQKVITKDNVTMSIDTAVFYQVTDPKLYTYGVTNPDNGPNSALALLTVTTLRNVIGDLTLDETLTSRDKINNDIRVILDAATDPWGIKVNRVEVKAIMPPKDIQEAMEKQMKAEREKRATILVAEGDKAAKILQAEGDKESKILRAEAEKQQMIKIAEGQASKIKLEKEAEALGITLLKEAKADQAVLTLRSLDTLAKVSEGQATKIIVPSEIQNLAGLITAVTEVADNKNKK